MTLAGLQRVTDLWRELKRTRQTSNRYRELAALIRAETSSYLMRTDLDQISSQVPRGGHRSKV